MSSSASPTEIQSAGTHAVPFERVRRARHATIQMTNYYTHATPEKMRRGVQALSGVTGESTRIVSERLRELA